MRLIVAWKAVGVLAVCFASLALSAARSAEVTVVDVDYGPSSDGRRVVASVTLQNNTAYSIKGKVSVTVVLPDRTKVKRKSVRLEPKSRLTVSPSAVSLGRIPYDDVTDVSAAFAVSKIYAPAAGSDLSGSWHGTYTHPIFGSSGAHATIVQQGAALTITTYFRGHSHSMSGTKSSGNVRVVDASDGQVWTSLGSVNAHQILLRDYLLEYPDRHPILEQDLHLSR